MANKKQKSVYREMFVTYVISGLVLTGILSFAFSRMISTFYTQKQIEVSRETLEVTFNSATSLLDNLYSEYYYLFHRQDQMVSYRETTVVSEQVVGRLLQASALSDSLVHQLILFDFKNQRIIDSTGTSTDLSEAILQRYQPFLSTYIFKENREKNDVFFHREHNHVSVLSTFFASSNASGEFEYVLLVDIDEAAFSKNLSFEESSSEILIVNPSGTIVADSTSLRLGELLPINFGVSNLLFVDESSSPIDMVLYEERSLVLMKKSMDLRFAFFHITPYAVIQTAVIAANRWVMLLFALFASINLVVGMVSAKRFYEPIKQLLSKLSLDQTSRISMNEYQLIESAMTELNVQGQVSAKKDLLLFQDMTHIDQLDLQFPVAIVVATLYDSSEYHQLDLSLLESWVKVSEDSWMNILSSEEVNLLSSDILVYGISQTLDNLSEIKKNTRFATAAAQYAKTLDQKSSVYYDSMYQTEFVMPKTSLHNQIVEYIHEYGLNTDFSFEEMASELGFSLGYIRQVFKDEEKVALNEYLIARRIDRAKDKLIHTNLSGREISELVGYSESRYFYTQFKQRVGMTIDQFRQSQRDGVTHE